MHGSLVILLFFQIDDLKGQLSTKMKELNTSKAAYDKMQAELDDMKSHSQEVEKLKQTSESELQAIHTQLDESKKEVETLKLEKADLESQVCHPSAPLQSLSHSLPLHSSLSPPVLQLLQQKQLADEAQQHRDDAEAKAQRYGKELDTAKAEKEEASVALERVTSQLEAFKRAGAEEMPHIQHNGVDMRQKVAETQDESPSASQKVRSDLAMKMGLGYSQPAGEAQEVVKAQEAKPNDSKSLESADPNGDNSHGQDAPEPDGQHQEAKPAEQKAEEAAEMEPEDRAEAEAALLEEEASLANHRHKSDLSMKLGFQADDQPAGASAHAHEPQIKKKTSDLNMKLGMGHDDGAAHYEI